MKKEHSSQAVERLHAFFSTPLDESIRHRLGIDPREHAIQLFQTTVRTVPAYRQFLASRGISPESIQSFEDFQSLPLTDKANYMQAYPLPGRCKGGSLSGCDRLAVSSGSTGVPTFWPRSVLDELDVALRFEQVFRYSFRAHDRDTLAVVCFPMGNWVGGVFSASCCWHLAQKGYPITVATPGNKVEEILRVVRELGPFFQQTILLGYPPFVRDVIDAGKAQGMEWEAYCIKLVFAGEVFTEEWRSLMTNKVGAANPLYSSVSLYGTSDGGVLGNETPLSIAIRRYLASNPEVAYELFGEARLPTLTQYDPVSRFFELIDGRTLAVTGDNGVPLIRYHIADRGGLMSYEGMMDFLAQKDVGLSKLFSLEEGAFPLPFAWVFGRADFTVSFYGANIYPENVMVGLEQQNLSEWVTGKFVMEVREDIDGAYLHIVVELVPKAESDEVMIAAIALSIKRNLLRLNSEFANYTPVDRQDPKVELRPFGDPLYFPVGVKHRYTKP